MKQYRIIILGICYHVSLLAPNPVSTLNYHNRNAWQSQTAWRSFNRSPITAHAPWRCMVGRALQRFSTTPGFAATLQHIIKSAQYPCVKGYLWELEYALHLNDQNNEEVLAFNTMIHDVHGRFVKQFDIITPRQWIECKNIAWHTSTKQTKKLREQLSKQHMLVLQQRTPTLHTLSSKQIITQAWHQWLKQHAINVYEHESTSVLRP